MFIPRHTLMCIAVIVACCASQALADSASSASQPTAESAVAGLSQLELDNVTDFSLDIKDIQDAATMPRSGSPSESGVEGQSIPEPASLGILGIALLAARRKRS